MHYSRVRHTERMIETLSSCLSMPEAETPERIVVTSSADPSGSDKSGLLVTALAELRRIMAVAAACVTGVRGAGMAGEKVRRVITFLRPNIRPMALEACGPDMTRLACFRACVCLGAVSFTKLDCMTGGRISNKHCACRAARARGRKRGYGAGLCTDVAGRTAFAGMACRAARGRSLRIASVMPQKSRLTMTRRNKLSCREHGRSIINRESSNHR